MDVKINGGFSQPVQPQKTPAADAPRGVSFAENLKAAAAPKAGGAEPTAEAVFERALSDREHPDLQQLDDYLESLIQKEMTGGGK